MDKQLKKWLVKASHLALGMASAAVSLSLTLPTAARPATLIAQHAESRINVRSGPSTATEIRCQGLRGDAMDIVAQQQQPDGYRWYYGLVHRCSTHGWVRGDLLNLRSASAPISPIAVSPEPNPSPSVPSPFPSVAPGSYPVTPVSQAVSSLPQAYTAAQVAYFLEIALGAEYGNSVLSIKKWEAPIKVRVLGSPTTQDRAALDAVVQELKPLLGGVSLDIVEGEEANLTIRFAPESEFLRYEPAYRPVNLGYFRTWWNQGKIYQARILISTTGVTPQERAHLIREELTQALGLMRDSYQYPESIFFQGWTNTVHYADIDMALVKLLYRPEIRPGMTREQVMQVLRNLQLLQS